MADALVSPAVGGSMWAVAAGLIGWSARKVRQAASDRLVPMMGVLGAFVFAAQMINFSIPGTGSSGHLTGGLILAILLGPYAAFLVIASVLTIQALFFADGGLLALGCNIVNMGFWSTFVVYPLIYRPWAGRAHGTPRAWAAAIVAAVVGLQLGAFSVVLETCASRISSLPFGAFLFLMQPIHLAIGSVEGLATAAVVAFVARARPEALPDGVAEGAAMPKPVLAALLAAAVALGAVGSWFASTRPDGLEWSVAGVTGRPGLSAPERGVSRRLAALQEKTAVLPDYGLRVPAAPPETGPAAAPEAWPAVSAGTSVSGVVGGALALVLAGLVGIAVRRLPCRAGGGE